MLVEHSSPVWLTCLLVPSLALLGGCGSAAQPSASVPLTEFGSDTYSWAPCPADLGGSAIECTQVEVPLDWADPEKTKTSVLVRRVPAEGESEGSLWLLDGGPGFAGDSFLEPGFVDVARAGHLDLYVPSHRGSIGSSALTCPTQQAPDSPEGGRVTANEWEGCLDALRERWGEELAPFTVKNGALDVAHLMARAGKQGRTLVFGGSYGSLWAHRLLLDTDATPDAVLLDSIVPIGASLERVDAHADAAVERVLESCADIPACAERFDPSPVAASRAAIARYAEGNGCGQDSAKLERAQVQALTHSLLQGHPDSWIRIVALFERLARCNKNDVAELSDLVERRSAPPPSSPTQNPSSPAPRYNPLLNRHLLYRELYRFDQTEEERSAFEATALAVGTNGSNIEAEAKVFGEGYRKLEMPARSTTAIRTFLLSGRFDPLDPPEWADDFNETLDEGTIIRVPWAGHSTLRYLGWEEGECGHTLFTSFVETGTPEVSCVGDQPAVDLGQSKDKTANMIDAWISGE